MRHNSRTLTSLLCGPLCHALSLLSLSSLLLTSMRRWRATVATSGEWQCKTGGVRRLAVANGPNMFQMILVNYVSTFRHIWRSYGEIAIHARQLRCADIRPQSRAPDTCPRVPSVQGGGGVVRSKCPGGYMSNLLQLHKFAY